MNKVATALDKIANSLEAKGLIQEAFEIDKISDLMDKNGYGLAPAPGAQAAPNYEELAKAIGLPNWDGNKKMMVSPNRKLSNVPGILSKIKTIEGVDYINVFVDQKLVPPGSPMKFNGVIPRVENGMYYYEIAQMTELEKLIAQLLAFEGIKNSNSGCSVGVEFKSGFSLYICGAPRNA
jgi:hypothetical protein